MSSQQVGLITEWRGEVTEFLGAFAIGDTGLSRRLPWWLHMHEPFTSLFVVAEVLACREPA
jgi:hypothetical protein